MDFMLSNQNNPIRFSPAVVVPLRVAPLGPVEHDATAAIEAQPHPSTLPDEAMVDVRTAAIITGLSKSTLDKRRVYGGGPVFVKYAQGGAVRYRVRDLRLWMKANSASSTSEHWAAC